MNIAPAYFARPLHWNDLDEFIQPKVEALLANIATRGSIMDAIANTRESLEQLSTC
jgi:hypothetical protein